MFKRVKNAEKMVWWGDREVLNYTLTQPEPRLLIVYKVQVQRLRLAVEIMTRNTNPSYMDSTELS